MHPVRRGTKGRRQVSDRTFTCLHCHKDFPNSLEQRFRNEEAWLAHRRIVWMHQGVCRGCWPAYIATVREQVRARVPDDPFEGLADMPATVLFTRGSKVKR